MKLKKIIKNCYLCIRYPFLIPRNRFTGLRYTNWKIHTYLHGERPKYKCVKGEDGVWKSVIDTPATDGLWGKAFENIQETKYLKDGTTYDSLRTVTKSQIWAVWYYIVEFWYEHILQWIHCIPKFTELDEMEPGWRKAFGIQMCEEIRKQLKKEGRLYSYRILQIKEKWGTLHWYDNGASDELWKIINKYENLSWDTCIRCGKPSTKITSGWISPYCNDCFPKESIVYMKKTKDKWKETEEYQKAWEEVEKKYAENKEEI